MLSAFWFLKDCLLWWKSQLSGLPFMFITIVIGPELCRQYEHHINVSRWFTFIGFLLDMPFLMLFLVSESLYPPLLSLGQSWRTPLRARYLDLITWMWPVTLLSVIILDHQPMTNWSPGFQPIVCRWPWPLGITVLTILAAALGAVIGRWQP